MNLIGNAYSESGPTIGESAPKPSPANRGSDATKKLPGRFAFDRGPEKKNHVLQFFLQTTFIASQSRPVFVCAGGARADRQGRWRPWRSVKGGGKRGPKSHCFVAIEAIQTTSDQRQREDNNSVTFAQGD